MKKLLCLLLSLCLLISVVPVVMSAADGEYVLANLGLRVNGGGTIAGHLTSAGQTFDPIDLTAYGYPEEGVIEAGKLGIQMDVLIDGDAALAHAFSGNSYDGQLEMTSSGTCDKDERMAWASGLSFSFGNWKRIILDLSIFKNDNGGTFNRKAWNYFRIYFRATLADVGLNYNLKICNVRLVDLTQTAPSVEDDPLGDGTFDVEPPVWHVVDVPDGYNNGDKIVAGYNLKEYVEAHSDVVQVQQCLKNNDYAPIIQSLCDGLAAAGGGALYIPSGRYPCRTEIALKSGVQIYGDRKAPVDGEEASGTILEVYAGKGSANAMPFLKMGGASLVRYLTFWYPEQGFQNDTVIPYSTTLVVGTACTAQDLTFVNSYRAIGTGPSFLSLPVVQDICGTALFQGMEFDCTIDIGRLENIHFSSKYWERSGLPGSPESDEDKAKLEAFLRFNAVGLNVLRIDWSYITQVTVEGYSAGMVFSRSSTGMANGQCLDLHFKDCRVGLSVIAIGVTGEMVSNSVFENCDYGIWLTEQEVNGVTGGVLQLINCEIDANEYAIYQQQGIMVQLLSSTVKNGVLGATYGWYNVVNTAFLTEAPQVVLENGTVSSVFVGCKDENGGDIVIQNDGFCPVIFDSEPAVVPEVVKYTVNEVKKQNRQVENNTLYLVDDLARDGKTDVTAALQEKLNNAKANGGGIVFLTTGDYLVNGTITVPTGVELRGTLDVGTIGAYHVGANIYVTRTTDLDTPSVVMEAGSGMRGIGFHYPDQGHNDEFKKYSRFTEYPYAIQGHGADIFIVNVHMHNVWNGLDLMTYRCDNHYVDYLGGHALNNMLKVGAGAEGGVIRNVHTNPGATLSDWEGIGLPTAYEAAMYRQVQNNCAVIRVGHVEDEILYNCFNYSGLAGVQVEAEESGKATLRAIGNAMDYSTMGYNILDCEQVDILNAQMCIFNKQGSALKHELYHVGLGAENTGTVNLVGALFWEQSSHWLDVQGGTLNVYGTNEYASVRMLAKVSETANLNIVALYVKHAGMYMPAENGDRVTINGGYHTNMFGDADKVNMKNMMLQESWWSFPADRVELPETANILFTESFSSGFDFQSMTQGAVSGSSVYAQSDRLMIELGTGRSAGATAFIENMTVDESTSVYNLEMRVNISKLSTDGQFTVNLNTSSGDVLYPFVFSEAGFSAMNADGESKTLCDFSVDARTYYRVRVTFDLRKEGDKTYTVTLLDDKQNVLAKSEAYAMPEDMQYPGEVISTVYVGAMDMSAEAAAENGTKATLDYVIFYSEDGVRGDVNGDGKVDSTDARMTLQYFVGSISEADLNMAAADVDGNGKVDSTDARLILQYFVGSITEFPAA